MFGKGSRVHYSDTELATQLKRAIELTYSITFFAALKNSKIAPISLASLPKVSRKLFGNTLSAFGFRLFCLRNVHLTTRASTFLAKVWMMPYEWALKLKLLTRDTCKTKYISRRDRESAEKPLHRDVNLRERLQNCYTALFQIRRMTYTLQCGHWRISKKVVHWKRLRVWWTILRNINLANQ